MEVGPSTLLEARGCVQVMVWLRFIMLSYFIMGFCWFLLY